MDTTTKMLVNQIRSNGYWKKGQSLGEGGWAEVYKFATGWEEYTLYIDSEDVQTIHAESDARAKAAFRDLFNLPEDSCWEIVRREYKITSIDGNVL